MRISKNAQLNFLQNTVFDMTLTNLVMAMVVLHEEFGFGKQRLDQFIKAVEAKVKVFDEMARDAVLDEKNKGHSKGACGTVPGDNKAGIGYLSAARAVQRTV